MSEMTASSSCSRRIGDNGQCPLSQSGIWVPVGSSRYWLPASRITCSEGFPTGNFLLYGDRSPGWLNRASTKPYCRARVFAPLAGILMRRGPNVVFAYGNLFGFRQGHRRMECRMSRHNFFLQPQRQGELPRDCMLVVRRYPWSIWATRFQGHVAVKTSASKPHF